MEKVDAVIDLSSEQNKAARAACFDADTFFDEANRRMELRLSRIRGEEDNDNVSFMAHMSKQMASGNVRI